MGSRSQRHGQIVVSNTCTVACLSALSVPGASTGRIIAAIHGQHVHWWHTIFVMKHAVTQNVGQTQHPALLDKIDRC
jgi:hypothetical protein